MLSLGRIEFINVAPVYYALENGILPHDFTFIRDTPAHLNEKMQAGELTVSSCSSIEFARRWRSYVLAKDLCIASHAPVLSVLLLAKKDISQWNGANILISGQSHTSVILTKLILSRRYGFTNTYTTGDVSHTIENGNIPDVILTIGDEALRLRHTSFYPCIYDLASLWKDWTGLPFVFALWIARKDAVVNLSCDPTEAVRKSRDYGLSHLSEVIRSVQGKTPLTEEELRTYYTQSLTYSLGDRELEGLTRFYAMAYESGHLAEQPTLRFLE